ncbi:MAG: hypothetical protein MJZ92_02980 [Paludibacteraceae bacterium]|nr:hypothetical protein [Paludibacteraceae bacterium]
MKKTVSLLCTAMVWLIVAIGTASLETISAATPKVTLEQLQNGGWEQYKGQKICITTPLVLCAAMYDSLVLSDERLFVPEETAYGLADGDSTEYRKRVAYNREHRIKLECKYPFSLNNGATIKNLSARVMGARHLQTGAQPAFRNYRPKKQVPAWSKADVRICAANIQNYFVHVGGYATKRNTPGQHALQCYKVASALTKIDADLYALCELEQGSSAPAELVAEMNRQYSKRHPATKEAFAFVVTDTCDKDTISCGFIYKVARLHPHGNLTLAYLNHNDIHAHRFLIQQFADNETGKRFYVSLNHPRSKRGDAAIANAKRMTELDTVFAAFERLHLTPDSMVLFLGDYNSYAAEQSTQKIVRAGYQDMNATLAPNDYSYAYKGECGFLDRCYASPSMAKTITSLRPLHWNTDYYYSAAYYSKYNYKNRNIPKTAPKNIRSVMSGAAKKNRFFRYADHDPLLISLHL